MKYTLKSPVGQLSGQINLSSSKSESNRALIMNALSGGKLELGNLSDARDTQTMQRLLTENAETWDVLDAGTTMRFCTAYLAVQGSDQTITGTPRMKERPIGLLVDALRKLGSNIDYLEKEGYPPLRINRLSEQKTNQLTIPGNISSQYISALLMIAPILPDGLELELTGEVYSRPYIEMTLALMQAFGIRVEWRNYRIYIAPQAYQEASYTIESDWSGASYWYSVVAMSKAGEITLLGLREKSHQGDKTIVGIMEQLGVNTRFEQNIVHLTRAPVKNSTLQIDFRTCPDLAQTVMVTAAVLGVRLEMTGLESLKIKETDRIAAMRSELTKLGSTLSEKDDRWILVPGEIPAHIIPIHSYEDHRMAMAFAPVCLKQEITIEDPDVVKKSYPGFWDDLRSVGVRILQA